MKKFLLILNYECIQKTKNNIFKSYDPNDDSILEFLKLFNIKLKSFKFSRKSKAYNVYLK